MEDSSSRVPAATPAAGLTAEQVAVRLTSGLGYPEPQRTSRSVLEILRANVLTRFNFILGTLLAVILILGEPQDALFGIVLVANALIGIGQELRAKRTLDRLAVLTAPTASVIRDGVPADVPVGALVTGDLIRLHAGDQVVADGVLRSSRSLQADESLLTGESETVDKRAGDVLLSGSFVIAGSGAYEATGVGSEAYARKLASQARQFTIVRSELVAGTNRILKYITWAIVPVAGLLLASQLLNHATTRVAVTGTVAALVGMVPQGLVLLTSIAFGVAAVTLSGRQVLVQQLPAVEGLARVDVVCFDKTGTLTDGSISFDRLVVLADEPIEAALGAIADDLDRNATTTAIATAFPHLSGWDRVQAVPFSSARKWSASSFAGKGTWVLGAPEIVLPAGSDPYLDQSAALAQAGQRVLVLARTNAPLRDQHLPTGLEPAAFVLLTEQLRANAADTVAFFAQQGVALKVISGDSPQTVGAVAARAGIPGWDTPVDARGLPDDPAMLGEALEDCSVFGRVAPHQKQAMITALQARGHTVAMTGDGVNDVLALKLADIGIAMGTATVATKAVAELVLLDGGFATLPGVVAEGRRVTANIERVANLFITKSVWATLLAVTVAAALLPYPFLPRHLTIIDTVTIGVPSFFLALAPNRRRYLPGFAGRVLRFAVPAGIVVAAATLAAYVLARARGLPPLEQRTSVLFVAVFLGLTILTLLASPLTWRRAILICAMIIAFALVFPVPAIRQFFAVGLPIRSLWIPSLTAAAGAVLLAGIWVAVRRRTMTLADRAQE